VQRKEETGSASWAQDVKEVNKRGLHLFSTKKSREKKNRPRKKKEVWNLLIDKAMMMINSAETKDEEMVNR